MLPFTCAAAAAQSGDLLWELHLWASLPAPVRRDRSQVPPRKAARRLLQGLTPNHAGVVSLSRRRRPRLRALLSAWAGNEIRFFHPESSSIAKLLSYRPSSREAVDPGKNGRASRPPHGAQSYLRVCWSALSNSLASKRLDDEAIGAHPAWLSSGLKGLQFAHRQQDRHPWSFSCASLRRWQTSSPL